MLPKTNDKELTDIVWTTLDSPAEKVAQGDLFYFEEEEESRRYGIVVTADCDLVNNKHSKRVSFVPLLSLDEILCNCLYVDHLEKIGDQIAKLLCEELESDVSVQDPSFAAAITTNLNDGREISAEISEAAKIFLHRSDCIGTSEYLALLKKLRMSEKTAFERFEQQVNSRGDIVVLTRPPYVEHDVKIVWLRSIWQVNLGRLALRNSSYVAGRNCGRHVARLASPFKYRLTQQFAQVFSDIGTPDIGRKWVGEELKVMRNVK